MIKTVTNVTFAIRGLIRQVCLKDIEEFTQEKSHMNVIFAIKALLNLVSLRFIE